MYNTQKLNINFKMLIINSEILDQDELCIMTLND